MSDLTQKELKEALHYDPKMGVFTWKVKKAQCTQIGDIAGCIHDGYLIIKFNNKGYRGHRLAWLYMYGYWPKMIDHINRDKTDNRIKNLRECTHSENRFNTNKRTDNTSGIKGVYWHKDRKKWQASIGKNGKLIYLGLFITKQEAITVRAQAEKYLYE